MSGSEKRRSMVLRRVEEGALTLEQATRVLDLSYRQMKRVWKRFKEEGEHGLAHRSKGRPSNRAFLDDFKERVLSRYRARAQGLGPTQFAVILKEEGVVIDHETLRRWLLETGGWKLSRSRHPRRAAGCGIVGFGELLSLVSVHESWLGDDLPGAFLLCLTDEATSTRLCRLSTEESSEAAMRLLWTWIDRYGIPAALRCPRRLTFEENRHPTLEQQLSGSQTRSAFSLCCERLGMATECLSPTQTKYTQHDMRPFNETLRGELASHAASLEEANALLAGALGEAANRRCAAPAASLPNYHVSIVDGTDLRRYFCVQQECRVGVGGIVENGTRRYRLLNGSATRATVLVNEWLDGSVHIMADAMEIPFLEVRARTRQNNPSERGETNPSKQKTHRRGASNPSERAGDIPRTRGENIPHTRGEDNPRKRGVVSARLAI
jgi:transposase